MTAALDFLQSYVGETPFDEEYFNKKLAESTEFTPTPDTYRAAIGAQFQDLLNRQATPQDIDYYTNYLKEFNITNPGQMSSSVAESLYLTPEFERKAPLTASEEKMAAYYGRPIRDEAGAKTGRYGSIISPINYQMG